jgi:hypothetical protein
LRRRFLIFFCVFAAALSAIALIPGILVLAIFLVIPAILLILAPYALLFGGAFLIADLWSPQAKFVRKAATAGLVIAAMLLALTGAAAWSNHAIEEDVQALTQQDHDLREPLSGTRNIAIQFVTHEGPRPKSKRPIKVSAQVPLHDDDTTTGAVPPPVRKQFCERLCLHLLFNGLADSVLVSSVPVLERDFDPPNLAEIGMSFHLERAACRDPAIKTDNIGMPPFRLFEQGAEKEFAEEISARMIAGQCVIGQPARLSEAQIIVQENRNILPLASASNYPLMKNALHLYLPPHEASRLTIYRVQDGNVEEVFRQTQVEAYPLLPVLLLGPVITGEGGIGITEGFLRRHRYYSEYNLRDVLKSKLGMDVAPISK